MFGFAREELGKGAIDGESSDVLADVESGDTWADCVHNAGNFIAENKRNFRRERVVALQHDQIGCAHACCLHADTELAWSRWDEWHIDDPEDFGSALLCQHHRAISRAHA